MSKIIRISVLMTVLAAALLAPGAVYAHPLGNFTVNQYAGLTVHADRIEVDYVMDMAEIPAFQEIAGLGVKANALPDSAQAVAYAARQCAQVRDHLELQASGRLLGLQLGNSAVEFPPGQGGLPTLRLTCGLQAAIPALNGETRLEFANRMYPDRLGWREITATGQSAALSAGVSAASRSQRLSVYPSDSLANPLDQRQASFTARPAAGMDNGIQPASLAAAAPLAGRADDPYTRLAQMQVDDLPALLFALLAAFAWGALHAFSPGHGKTVVGAYLVGARGTASHALYLGLTTTVTHTIGVFILGGVTLFAARYILPEQLFPWLSFISGGLVVLIGLNLFVSRLRSRPHDHDHSHDHDHLHSHDHGEEQGHDHPHGPDHDHSHMPPGADGRPLSGRSLLALGISGGLLPCPSALVVLLSSIAVNRVGFGLALVVAFSLGLAGVLTAIGLTFVYAGNRFNRLPIDGRLARAVPAVSALLIALIGFGIAVRALVEAGLLHL
jgi:ABC-type nickel/cobalt efflux system permease component RcnA